MYKLSSINALPLKKIVSDRRFKTLLSIGTTLLLFITLSGVIAQDVPEHTKSQTERHNKLAYVSDEGYLMLYDPHARTEVKLLANIRSFIFSPDNRVAYTRLDESDTDVYVFDSSTPAREPINISQSLNTNSYPLAWSPDGRYLAFVSYTMSDDYFHTYFFQGNYHARSDDQILYVWDGEQVTDIMPIQQLDTASAFYVDWSPDGRLAFTIEYSSSSLHPAEIYLWDGSTTTNVSQNLDGWDGGGSWSQTGQFRFRSMRDGEIDLFIWDGASFRDGSPDINSFLLLETGLQEQNVKWTDEDGIIAFTTHTDASLRGAKEIVWWDIEAQTIVRRIPIASDKAFSSLAEGGRFILSSHLASGLPSVYLDVETLEGDVLFSDRVGNFSWTSSGYLAFCSIGDDGNWILSIWNGEETWEVARTNNKPVQWRSEQYVFSCNNG